jgi:hypothetical protein
MYVRDMSLTPTRLATSAGKVMDDSMSVESVVDHFLSETAILQLAARVCCFALSELVYEQMRELSLRFLRAALKVIGGFSSAHSPSMCPHCLSVCLYPPGCLRAMQK